MFQYLKYGSKWAEWQILYKPNNITRECRMTIIPILFIYSGRSTHTRIIQFFRHRNCFEGYGNIPCGTSLLHNIIRDFGGAAYILRSLWPCVMYTRVTDVELLRRSKQSWTAVLSTYTIKLAYREYNIINKRKKNTALMNNTMDGLVIYTSKRF